MTITIHSERPNLAVQGLEAHLSAGDLDGSDVFSKTVSVNALAADFSKRALVVAPDSLRSN